MPGHGGRDLLVCPSNFFYIKNTTSKINKNKMYWRCKKQRDPDLKCPGTATTKEENGKVTIVSVNNKHNHPPEIWNHSNVLVFMIW